MEEINKTENYGYTEIEIAKVGEYNGSDNNGNPVPEHLTEESLKKIVEDVNAEGKDILVDKQHSSMKVGLERDDSACGWLKALSFKNGSIFGKCFWTKLGRELVDSKILRFISPVFHLGEDGVPKRLVNVALVNTPALTDIAPVINQANEILENPIEKEYIDMTKEEVIELIKATVTEMKNEKTEDEKPTEEVKEVVEEVKEETAKEAVDNACSVKNEDGVEAVDTQEEIVKKTAEETVNEEPVEEKKEEDKIVDKDKIVEEKEVIKIEALNSAPVPTMVEEPAWKKMSPAEFCKWYDNGRK